MSYMKHEVTTVTNCDHRGHNHSAIATIASTLCPPMLTSSSSPMLSCSYSYFNDFSNDSLNLLDLAVDDEVIVSSDSFNNYHQQQLEATTLMAPLSYSLEEEVVPFFDQTAHDIFLDLDLPTVYGNRSSNNNDILLNDPTATGNSFWLDDAYDGNSSFEQQMVLINDSLEKQTTPDVRSGPNLEQNATQLNEKTRKSIFHTLLWTIVDKVDKIKEKTGATVSFYIVFGTLELTEKNVHNYLANRQHEQASVYTRFPALFNNTSVSSPSKSASFSSRGTVEVDDGIDETGVGDHLYAATLLTQTVFSSVHDHQYDEVLSQLKAPTAGLSSECISNSASSVKSITYFKTDYQRHRTLSALVDTLFRKVGSLETKTDATIMSFVITYEGQQITRQNHTDILAKLTELRGLGLTGACEEQKSDQTPQQLQTLSNLSKKKTKTADKRRTVANHSNEHVHVVNEPNGNGLVVRIVDDSQKRTEPICSDCSQPVPVGSNSSIKWMWLRCSNALCPYLIHSTCLGFYANSCSLDLNQFTFPPFYCKQHRMKLNVIQYPFAN